ncbi:MAG: WD40-like Beta Propeller Repeat [Acidobacteria bacterium]|nr:WD40-like Beta Propeller Repeat [Acidobacteriota bacterium]
MKRICLITTMVGIALGFGAVAVLAAEFSDWSAPVNLGPVVNSPYLDSCVAISKNGLSLFFSSTRQTENPSSQDRDLYVSERESIDAPWGQPVALTMLNSTGYWDSCPALNLDEHLLYFTSTRSGGYGGMDIWVSHRHDRRDNFGWEPPVHLGSDINTALVEITPAFFEDESGKVWMYFASGATTMSTHIYQSEVREDDSFGPVTPVTELNSLNTEMGPIVRRDGLEVIFLSSRAMNPIWDFYRATRESTADPWSELELVPSLGFPALAQGRIALSFDGSELYFTSYRAGGYGGADLWVARREKLRGHGKDKD